MSNAIAGFGTLLKRGDGGSPETFTTIAEVASFGGLNMSADTIDATHTQSPGAWREFIVGLKDAGELSFDVNLIPSEPTHSPTAGLIQDFNNGTRRNYQIVFPDNSTFKCNAGIRSLNISPAVDGKLSASITLKMNGQPTWS